MGQLYRSDVVAVVVIVAIGLSRLRTGALGFYMPGWDGIRRSKFQSVVDTGKNKRRRGRTVQRQRRVTQKWKRDEVWTTELTTMGTRERVSTHNPNPAENQPEFPWGRKRESCKPGSIPCHGPHLPVPSPNLSSNPCTPPTVCTDLGRRWALSRQITRLSPLVRSVHCRMEAALFFLSRGVCVALATYLGGSWTPSFLSV